MPNHWHLALWLRPGQGAGLSKFIHWLTLTHTRRWHRHRHSDGAGHLYQGPFKPFPVQPDHHLLKVFRYIEQNALRAELVQRAEDWSYGSLWHRHHPTPEARPFLADWPVAVPANWNEMVNVIPDPAELAALRLAGRRGRPFGSGSWTATAALRLGLESTLRGRGRPRRAVAMVDEA